MIRTALLLIQSFIHYFPQTLTYVDLYANEIGDQGAEHLANALQQNKVTRFILLFFLFNHSFTILQILITLNLEHDKIGDQGAEHLANALQQNKVTQFVLLFFLFNHSLPNFYRH